MESTSTSNNNNPSIPAKMTKMLRVDIDTSGVDQSEATEWVNELANVYADMQIEDVKVLGNKISFKAGFSGMDDTDPDDVKVKVVSSK
jgi:hypothetical protein